MRARFKHILSVVVLVVYLLSGAMTFWGALGQVFCSSSPVQFLTGGKKPRSQPVKVVWTQQKHYPSSSNDNVPAPALVCDSPIHHFEDFWAAASALFIIQPSSFHPHENSPRAPPFLS